MYTRADAMNGSELSEKSGGLATLSFALLLIEVKASCRMLVVSVAHRGIVAGGSAYSDAWFVESILGTRDAIRRQVFPIGCFLPNRSANERYIATTS